VYVSPDKAESMSLVLLHLHNLMRRALPDRDREQGAAVVEYALLIAFIFAVLLVSVNVIGDTSSAGLDEAGSSGFVGP
jgi:Flp pilus assembly pilin Flp